MTMLPADASCISRPPTPSPASGLEKVLRGLSVFTMLMTVPQVLTVWVGRDAGGVSLVSWLSYLLAACLWFVYGFQKRDKTITSPASAGWCSTRRSWLASSSTGKRERRGLMVRRVLTGITTSGTPHLGNYAGAIRPAIAASRQAGVESFYFLADYHALIHAADPARVQRSTLEIAAAWLAAGLDPDKVVFYRQSDIPEILELAWLLACVTGKGLLNRAHAYKAAVDRNTAAGADPDAGVSMGLFMYPVLMAADILLFKANSVPVGRDQLQHIEMARDMAERFNHRYGEHLVLPEAAIDDSVAHAARARRPQDEQELRQQHPAVRARGRAEEADLLRRHRFARAGRAEGRRGLRAVPALRGFCDAGGDGADARGVRRRHRLGRGQAERCSSASKRRSRRCAAATRSSWPMRRGSSSCCRRVRSRPARSRRLSSASCAGRRGCAGCSDVGKPALDDARGRRVRMHHAMRCVEDVKHLDAARAQHIGDERPVAAPPHCFCAHQCRAQLPGKLEQLVQSAGKLRAARDGRHSRETRRCARRCWANRLWAGAGRRAPAASDSRCHARRANRAAPPAHTGVGASSRGSAARPRLPPAGSGRAGRGTHPGAAWSARSSRPSRSLRLEDRYRTTVTGTLASCSTFIATEPSTRPASALRPRVPITIWSQRFSRASLRMSPRPGRRAARS